MTQNCELLILLTVIPLLMLQTIATIALFAVVAKLQAIAKSQHNLSRLLEVSTAIFIERSVR